MSDFPASLWNQGRFEIPDSLIDPLWVVFERHGLVEMAQLEETPKVCGGVSKEDTDEYFAKLGAVSCIRPMSVLLYPEGKHQLPRKLLRECMHQGKVALIDFPSGCGTTSLGLLSSVEQMRRERHWIAFDLEVKILALDISPHALQHFQDLFDKCERKLDQQLIQVTLETEVVNIEDKEKVSMIVNDWVTSVENDADYILVGHLLCA